MKLLITFWLFSLSCIFAIGQNTCIISFDLNDFEIISSKKDSILEVIPTNQKDYKVIGRGGGEIALPAKQYVFEQSSKSENIDFNIINIKKKLIASDVYLEPIQFVTSTTIIEKYPRTRCLKSQDNPIILRNTRQTNNTFQTYLFISPFLYDHVLKRLYFIESLQLSYSDDIRQVVQDGGRNKRLSQNSLTSSESDVEYLVIGQNEMHSAIQPLIEWKRQKGIRADFISLENIQTTYQGSTVTEKIKRCIYNHYKNRNLKWVLLAGNKDIIPTKYCRIYVDNYKDTTACDLYYACLDSANLQWGNSDTIWSQQLDDIYPRICIGRIPISNQSQLEKYITKLVEYEKCGPLRTNYKKMLLAGSKLFQSTFDAEYKAIQIYENHVKDSLVCGYDALFNISEYSAENIEPFNKTNFKDALENGYHYTLLITHGSRDSILIKDSNNRSLPSFTKTDIDSLKNSTTVLFAACCYFNFFTSDGHGMGESFINNPNGQCLCSIGPSCQGIENINRTILGANSVFLGNLMDSLFSGLDCYRIGEAFTKAKRELV